MAKTGAIAKLKAMAEDLPSYDAKALKELVASGGDVPANYKGREHVWAKKVKKFAEGGKVEDKAYIGYRRAGRRPESQQNREASANIPVAVARGLVSGTLGLPGDIESLARMPYELITGKESKTILPTSEDIEKRLPFRGSSQTPVGQMFTGAGQLAGGAYTGPLSGARAAMAVPRAAVRAGRDFVQAAGQNVSPLTVYHGSPHKFEKFDSSKIGTGEGAQSYGQGLYFAESPNVAKSYVPRSPKFEENLVKLYNKAQSSSNYPMMEVLEDAMLHRTPGEILQKFSNVDDGYTTQHAKAAQDFAKWYEKNQPEIGGLYTVDLPDEKIARMLDWDKPLSEQESVKAALNAINKEIALPRLQDAEGAGFAYQHLANAVGGPQNAAALLREAGIPGIKYLDEQSRGATGTGKWKITMKNGEQKIYDFKPNDDVLEQMGATAELAGTRNFVVFPGEEDALTILERKKEGGEVKMAEGGAAFGRYTTGRKYQGAVKRAKEADVNKLPDPRTYAAVMGLLGSAPDELGFSVMHPDYKGIQKAGERGFVGGTILGVAPVVAPLTRGLPVGAAIKPVGGNWMTGGVERALEPLKTRTIAGETPAQRIPRHRALLQDPSLPPESKATVQRHLDEEIKRDAIDQWVNRNLTNYVKKQMATPDDPVRGLAERGIVHKNIDQAIPNWQFETTRKKSGYPVEGFGQSQQAKDWENLTDASFVVKKAKELIDPNYMEDIRPMYREMQAKANLENNPWLSKVDPEANIYHASTHDLGFDHIVDVLKQDLDAGRIRPDQLNKVSMEQAVRRTYEYDQEMAKKMREAQIKATEGMPVHKEYPEGYRWIELAPPKELTGGVTLEPKAGGFDIIGPGGEDLGWAKTKQDAIRVSGQHKALEDALKYEGDTMGHCVGGYCPDVLEGRSRIYSLRDAKGEPHVTVEVEPRSLDTKNWFFEQPNEIVDEIRSMVGNSPTPAQMADAIKSHPKYIEDSAKVSPAIVQIKGKQNRAPKEEYLPFVQDFVRSGQWSGVGDLPNTGMFKIESGPRATEFDRAAFERYGNYATTQELDDLERMLKAQQPEGMKAGGAVGCGCNDEPKMQAGGAIKTLKNLLGGGAKAEDAATAAQRAAAGRMAADVAKATQPMKMSEALGNLNVEGKGKVKVTQSDRTRVGGGNIGGAMFPGLSQVDPFYQDLVWGVGKKSTGSGLINQSDDLTYWSTLLGSEDQLKSNPIVFNKLRAGFVDAMKQGKLSKELEDKINKNLSVTFGEGANIRDPKIWQKADTFERRTALADVMLGQGLPPNKGGVPLGGEKSGKGVIFKPTDILKRETEPLLLHPEHGGDVPTFAVGPRLFQFSGGMKVRPDLHPGFPFLLEGQDMGMVFRPAPGEIAMRDFNQRMLTERGRKPGYYEWTMGEKGKGLPSQLITDEYLTYLQKQGYAEGGKVKSGLSALEKV